MNYCVDVVLLLGPRHATWMYLVTEEEYNKIGFSSIVKVDFGDSRNKDCLGFVLRKYTQTDVELDTRYMFKQVKSVVMYRSLNEYQCNLITKILDVVRGKNVIYDTLQLFITEKMIMSMFDIKGTYTKIYTLNKSKCIEYKPINDRQEEIIRVLMEYNNNMSYREIKELKLSTSSLSTLVKKGIVDESKVFDNKNIKLNYKKNDYKVDKVMNKGLIVARNQKLKKIIVDNIYHNITNNKQTLIIAPSIYDVDYWFDQLKELDINVAKYRFDTDINDKLLIYRGLNSGVIQVIVAEQKGLFFPYANLGQVILLNQESINYKRKKSPYYNLNLLLDKLDNIDVLKTSLTPSIKEVYKLGNKKLPNVKPDINYIPVKGSLDKIIDKICSSDKKQLFIFLYKETPVCRCLECGKINFGTRCYNCHSNEVKYTNICSEWLIQELRSRGHDINKKIDIVYENQYERDYSKIEEIYVLGAKFITRPFSIEGFVNEYSLITNISTNFGDKINLVVESDKKDLKLDTYPVMMENILSSLSKNQVFPYYPMIKVYIEQPTVEKTKKKVREFLEVLRRNKIKFFYNDYIYKTAHGQVCEIPIVLRDKTTLSLVESILDDNATIVLL